MGLFDWVRNWMNPDGTMSLKECQLYELQVEAHYKKLAIDSAINLIANALVRSKFHTYEKGKKAKGNNYYLFNVKPNQNQNATEFYHKLVSNLIFNNEALVVMQGESLYIADSWDKKEFAFQENIYNNVEISGYKLNKSFNESEVFSFKLNNDRIVKVIDSLYSSYGKLLGAAIHSYKRGNSMKAIIEIDSSLSLTDKDQEEREDLFNVQFKNFFAAEGGAILPLSKGLNYKEVKSTSGNNTTSRDVRAIIDDVFDMVSIAFHVPKGLLKGDLADVEGQVDNFLMFAVNPIAELFNDEINCKMYTKQEYLDRTYLKVDTMMVKYVDPTKLAVALDKLLSSGTHNVDENREMIGSEPLNEEWSQEYYITKNYQRAEDFMKEQAIMKGGE
jgi:HK97 family phage portal protein